MEYYFKLNYSKRLCCCCLGAGALVIAQPVVAPMIYLLISAERVQRTAFDSSPLGLCTSGTSHTFSNFGV
jgi:hypothetical protein